jgi:hypothetical protein
MYGCETQRTVGYLTRVATIRNRGSRTLFAASFTARVADIAFNIGIPCATRHRQKMVAAAITG